MKKFLLMISTAILFLVFSSCLTIPRNDNKGKCYGYIKVVSEGDWNYVKNSTLYVSVYKDDVIKGSIELVNPNTTYDFSSNFSEGEYSSIKLSWRESGDMNKDIKKYKISQSLENQIIFKRNCLTIIPYKLIWRVESKTLDAEGHPTLVRVYSVLKEYDFKNNEVDDLINELKKNDNVKTYDAVYFGNTDITDKIKLK
jgi:hypothetical protein